MIKLPLSKEFITEKEFDFILIVINRLIKWGTFISYKKLSTAENLIYIFLWWIVAEYRFPQELILDRDKLFIFRFWKALMAQLDVKYKLFMVYYPQTDRQTERMNQTLE